MTTAPQIPQIRGLDDLPDLASTEQVAEAVGLPIGTLRYLRHRGYGGPKSFALTPRAIRYRKADVIAWIEEQIEAEHGGKAA